MDSNSMSYTTFQKSKPFPFKTYILYKGTQNLTFIKKKKITLHHCKFYCFLIKHDSTRKRPVHTVIQFFFFNRKLIDQILK